MTPSSKTLRLNAALTALAAIAGTFGDRSLTPMIQPTVELVLPAQARLGDTVTISLRVRNDGSQPIDLQLPGRPVAFDVIVRGAEGTEVWRRLRETVTASALMLVQLAPGQARDFTVEWAQVDNGGRPVAPGSYLVTGVLPMEARKLTTAPRELVITR